MGTNTSSGDTQHVGASIRVEPVPTYVGQNITLNFRYYDNTPWIVSAEAYGTLYYSVNGGEFIKITNCRSASYDSGNSVDSTPFTVPDCVTLEFKLTWSASLIDGDETEASSYGTTYLGPYLFNNAPTEPTGLICGSPAAGKLMAVDWTASTDDDGDEITYCVEYDFDSSGVWTQAGQTTGLTLPILIPSDGGYGTIAVRVKAMDTKGGESGYTTSEAMTISYNTAPVISGEDTSLGSFTAPPVYTYTVTDPDDGQTITVTEKIITADGTDHVLRTYTADSGAQNTFAWTALGWLICQNGINTLVITATDGTETVQRRVTFQRQVNEISAARAVSTDAMPAKVLLSFYPSPATLPGDCTIEAYVTNNPFDAEPVWEDVSEKLNLAVHTFANSTCANGYGIGYRFKITKGESKVYFDTAVLRFA